MYRRQRLQSAKLGYELRDQPDYENCYESYNQSNELFFLFFSYDPFFLPQCNFSEILRCRHICSSTDRSLPKSSISNAICISSYAQTGIMKTGVPTVWQPGTSCKMLPVRCIHSRFEPVSRGFLHMHIPLSLVFFCHNTL